MYPFSIGVILDSFRTDLTTALDKAVAVGASGLQALPTRRRIQNSSSDPSAFWIWPRIWRLTW